MQTGVDFKVKDLREANAVKFATDLPAFCQPLGQRGAFDSHMNDLHVM